MNDFIYGLKDDLLDRRLLPAAAVVALALLGALVYAMLGGSSETPHTAALSHSTPGALGSGMSISLATREDALAETTSGGREQSQGPARNPFEETGAQLAAQTAGNIGVSSSASSPGSAASNASAEGAAQHSSSTGGTGSGSPSGSSTPSQPSTPSAPSKPKTVYHVDVLFGEIPPGETTAPQLAAHDNLKLLTPLPSHREPLVVFRGVKTGGRTVTFTVAGEAILSGDGVCKPSSSQCETISLQAGQTEELQYLPAGATQMLRYELRVVRIAAAEASAAAVASLWRGESVAGLEVLRQGNLLALPGLRQSTVAGVLVPAS